MNEYTSAQVRELAKDIHLGIHVSDLPYVLHSLADQVEALTVDCDALQAYALKFNWLLEVLTGHPDCEKDLLLFAAIEKLDMRGLTPVELVAYLDTAISDAMKEPK